MPEPSIHRVYQLGRPRFQLRQGEQGVSVFDAGKTTETDILPYFRSGSLVTTQEVATIESFGLAIVESPGDPGLPELLQKCHMEIRQGEGMTRKEFKEALKALEAAIGEPS